MRKKLGTDPFSEKKERINKYLKDLFNLSHIKNVKDIPNIDDTKDIPEIKIINQHLDKKQQILEYITTRKNAGVFRIAHEFNISAHEVMQILKTLKSEGKISLG